MSEMLADRLKDEIERLRAENEALRKDAERYRYLRAGNESSVRPLWGIWRWADNAGCNDYPPAAFADMAIDAALAAREGA